MEDNPQFQLVNVEGEDAFYWLLPLIKPIGNSACLNSAFDFVVGAHIM